MTVSFGIKSPPPNVLIALGCRPSRISIQGYKGNKKKWDFEQKFKHESYRTHTTTCIRTELLKTNTASNNVAWISKLSRTLSTVSATINIVVYMKKVERAVK